MDNVRPLDKLNMWLKSGTLPLLGNKNTILCHIFAALNCSARQNQLNVDLWEPVITAQLGKEVKGHDWRWIKVFRSRTADDNYSHYWSAEDYFSHCLVHEMSQTFTMWRLVKMHLLWTFLTSPVHSCQVYDLLTNASHNIMTYHCTCITLWCLLLLFAGCVAAVRLYRVARCSNSTRCCAHRSSPSCVLACERRCCARYSC